MRKLVDALSLDEEWYQPNKAMRIIFHPYLLMLTAAAAVIGWEFFWHTGSTPGLAICSFLLGAIATWFLLRVLDYTS